MDGDKQAASEVERNAKLVYDVEVNLRRRSDEETRLQRQEDQLRVELLEAELKAERTAHRLHELQHRRAMDGLRSHARHVDGVYQEASNRNAAICRALDQVKALLGNASTTLVMSQDPAVQKAVTSMIEGMRIVDQIVTDNPSKVRVVVNHDSDDAAAEDKPTPSSV